MALIGASIAPAGAGTNGLTTYEADCTSSLAPGLVAPFVQGLDVNASPDPSSENSPFGASGTATQTIIGPVIAGIEQALPSPMIGAALTETVGSTDGSATGSFSYSQTFPQVPADGRNIPGVSWGSGETTLTAAAGTFVAGDVGHFVAGPTGGGIDAQSVITAVAGDGASATISIATTAAAGPVAVGTGQNMTFVDPAFSTGNVFTTDGTGVSNIGITSVTSVTVNALIAIPFGGSPGVGATNCLLTGWDAANNPGPAQQGALTPALPPGNTTPLVLASGGFITQPGTTQAITPPAAAFVTVPPPADTEPPVAGDLSVNLTAGNSTTVALPATDNVAVASCDLVPGSVSDPRLTVSISNSPTPCEATLTDSGTTSAMVTFQYNAMDTSGNVSTSPGTVTVNIIGQVVDGALDVIVNGPTRTAAGAKTIVGKATNLGTSTIQVCDTDISWDIQVGGVPTAGPVDSLRPGCSDLGPGASKRFRFRWTYGAGEVSPGAEVSYMGTLSVPGDVDLTNNTDTELRTAR